MNKLESEVVGVMLEAHHELLKRFGESKRNQLRAQIIQFRQVLKEVMVWAQKHELLEVFGKARWWEWYWFEREYSDSHFEPVKNVRDLSQPGQMYFFDRDCALLAIYTLHPSMLAREFRRQVTFSHPAVALTNEVPWDDLIKAAGPILKKLIRDAVKTTLWYRIKNGFGNLSPSIQSFRLRSDPKISDLLVRLEYLDDQWYDLSDVSVTPARKTRRILHARRRAASRSLVRQVDREVDHENLQGIDKLKADLLPAIAA
jgi:hypothetical protein